MGAKDPVLSAEASATPRDQLLAELEGLGLKSEAPDSDPLIDADGLPESIDPPTPGARLKNLVLPKRPAGSRRRFFSCPTVLSLLTKTCFIVIDVKAPGRSRRYVPIARIADRKDHHWGRRKLARDR